MDNIFVDVEKIKIGLGHTCKSCGKQKEHSIVISFFDTVYEYDEFNDENEVVEYEVRKEIAICLDCIDRMRAICKV